MIVPAGPEKQSKNATIRGVGSGRRHLGRCRIRAIDTKLYWMYNLYMNRSRDYNISEARRILPSLVHELERHPERVYRIRSRGRLVAELKAPASLARPGLAARRLLALSRGAAREGKASSRISEDTDLHLY